jgi:hypothetical protein
MRGYQKTDASLISYHCRVGKKKLL